MSSTAFKKKDTTRKILLYFHPDPEVCPYSSKFLELVAKDKLLAKKIHCVDVTQFDVEGIEDIPAIDDGSKKPFEGREAFVWLIKNSSSPSKADRVQKYVSKLETEDEDEKKEISNPQPTKRFTQFQPVSSHVPQIDPDTHILERIAACKNRPKQPEPTREELIEEAKRIWKKEGLLGSDGVPQQKPPIPRTGTPRRVT